MKRLIEIFLILLILFLFGCGGGGSADIDNDPPTPDINYSALGAWQKDTYTYDIEELDTDDRERVVFTKENAFNLLDLREVFHPLEIDISRNEMQYSIDKLYHFGSSHCESSGKVYRDTNLTRNQFAVIFDECTDSSNNTINGTVVFYLDKNASGENVDYTFGKDILITSNNKTIKYNYTFKRHREDLDFYGRISDINDTEVLESNFRIRRYHKDSNSGNHDVNATYILSDGTYFSLSGENLGMHFDWDHESNYHFSRGMGATPYAHMYLEGKDSHVVDYMNEEGFNKLTNLVNLVSHGETYYADYFKREWFDDIYELVENDFNKYIILSIGEDSVGRNDLIVTGDNNISLDIQIRSGDEYNNYQIFVTPISKPLDSNASMKEQNITSVPESVVRDKYSANLRFDKDGSYKFKITVIDDEDIDEREFVISHYNKDFSQSQYVFDGNIIDAIFLPDVEKIAVLSSDPVNKLTIIDSNGSIDSILNLPDTVFGFAVDENYTSVAISSEDKVFLVDIEDINNIHISNTYSVPDTIKQIAVYKNYAYALASHYVINQSKFQNDLYSIDLTNGQYEKIENVCISSRASLILNTAQDSIYILNTGLTPKSIHKFDISLGNASELYTSAYIEYGNGISDIDSKVWKLSEEEVILSVGTRLTMDSAYENDSQYKEKLLSEYFVYTSWGSRLTVINSLESNEIGDKLMYVIGEGINSHSYNATSDEAGYDNTLEVKNLSSMETIYSDTIKKYCIIDNQEYRLLVESIKFLPNNKIFIVYKAIVYFTKDDVYHGRAKDKAYRYIYEIKDLQL